MPRSGDFSGGRAASWGGRSHQESLAGHVEIRLCSRDILLRCVQSQDYEPTQVMSCIVGVGDVSSLSICLP